MPPKPLTSHPLHVDGEEPPRFVPALHPRLRDFTIERPSPTGHGNGLFATRVLPAGSWYYVGFTCASAEHSEDFDNWSECEDHPDRVAYCMGDVGSLINHSSLHPNCHFEFHRARANALARIIVVIGDHAIQANQELFADYGPGYDSVPLHG